MSAIIVKMTATGIGFLEGAGMIELAASPSTVTVTLSGDIDLSERRQFPEAISRISRLGRRLVVVDMCAVTYLDSVGAAFLITVADRTRRRGAAAVLRGCSDRDLFILEMCGALALYRVDPDHACPPPPGAHRSMGPRPG